MKNFYKVSFLLFILSLFLAASVSLIANDDKPGVDPDNFDQSVKPSDNFYNYVSGGWMSKTEIPTGYSYWGSFSEVYERNSDTIKTIFDEVIAGGFDKGSNKQMVGDIYYTFMDTVAINNNGLPEISKVLAKIDNVKSKEELPRLFAELSYLGVDLPIGVYSGQDDKASENVILNFYQSGLGLPERDYYLSDDEYYKNFQTGYKNFLTQLMVLAGTDENTAKQNAEKVYDLEKRFANATLTSVEQRDPEKTYNKFSKPEAESKFKNFDLAKYISSYGISDADLVNGLNFSQPLFFEEFDKAVGDVDLDTWKTYLKASTLNSNADFISTDFERLNFDFYSRQLNGTKQMQPRWKKAMSVINGSIGEALGELFVEKSFSPVAKERANEMIKDIISSMRTRLQNLSWMSDETKVEAFKKLDKLGVKIGYPDVWQGYAGLDISRASLLNNILNARTYLKKRNISELNKPVNKNKWLMLPHYVNAYYSASNNEIVFPAGILQPPFFSEEFDDALNYGGIGGVIGHEITHGYDDNGRRYDADGNMKNWWTEEDLKKFQGLTQQVVDQFDEYVAIDTFHVNGELTLGENIADLGGLTIAYYALKEKLARNNPGQIDGFTPEQRYFISWAQIWRSKGTDQIMQLLLKTDVHAPGYFRVIGPVSNMKEFQEAFNLSDDAPALRPLDKRIVIW